MGAVLISHICICMSYAIFEVCVRFVCKLLCICVCECVCVSVWVPGSVMVPGGRPASISEQQALVHCPSIDGPPVPDGGLLPAVTGQDMCVCVRAKLL